MEITSTINKASMVIKISFVWVFSPKLFTVMNFVMWAQVWACLPPRCLLLFRDRRETWSPCTQLIQTPSPVCKAATKRGLMAAELGTEKHWTVMILPQYRTCSEFRFDTKRSRLIGCFQSSFLSMIVVFFPARDTKNVFLPIIYC